MNKTTSLVFVWAVLAAACGHAPAKTGTLRYSENFNLDVRDVPTLMALDTMAAQGYTVERVDMSSSALVADALARGDADMAAANVQTIWSAIGEGAGVRTVMQKFGSTLTLVTTQELQACADLQGRSIGVAAANNTNTSLMLEYIDQTCPGTEPQLVVIPENDGRLAALASGQLDGALMQSEQVVLLESQAPGRFHQLGHLYELFADILNQGVYVNSDFAAQHPEIVKDYIRAVLLSYREVIAHPETLYKETTDRIGLDPADAQATGQAYLDVGFWDANGGLTEQRVQTTLDFLQKRDAVPASLTVANVADLSYL
jgi:ABC-type nitrate/sulfonate/bicarbonate transport system substrate-binding protein